MLSRLYNDPTRMDHVVTHLVDHVETLRSSPPTPTRGETMKHCCDDLHIGDHSAQRATDCDHRRRPARAHVHAPFARSRCTSVLLPDREAGRVPRCYASPTSTTIAATRSSPCWAMRSWLSPATTAPRHRHRGDRAHRRGAWQHHGVGQLLATPARQTCAQPRLSRVSSPRCCPTTGPRSASCTSCRPTQGQLDQRRIRGVDAAVPGQLTTAGQRVSAVSLRAIAEAVHETQRRPRVVDRAHFVVDQPVRQRPISRTAASRRSVATHALRFGHAIHSPPAGAIACANESKRSFELRVTRREEQHDIQGAARLRAKLHARRQRFQRAFEPSGARTSATRAPSLMPSLLGSAVPE
jgi:hypothetical protein